MAKQLRFTYHDKDYTLEFTRRSVKEMENNGFVAGNVADKPMNTLPELFAGAFLAHHPSTSKKLIREIYGKFPRKRELISRLAEMYTEPINSLVADPEDGAENFDWTANWEQETAEDE